MKQLISIQTAKYLKDYKTALKFNDNKENIVDFESFIIHSQHPDVKKYKDIKLFKKFNLEHGDLEWNDYDLVFPVYDLYKGKIEL